MRALMAPCPAGWFGFAVPNCEGYLLVSAGSSASYDLSHRARTKVTPPLSWHFCAYNPPNLSWPRFFPLSRSEEHTSALQSPSVISYAVFCLKKKKNTTTQTQPLAVITQPQDTTVKSPS